MFSGIIENLARVKSVASKDQALVLQVETTFQDLALGESIAINGVCLTVVEFTDAGSATFFVSSETISRSNLGALKAESLINLERAVKLETRLSGHLVQGHVDGKASLVSVISNGQAYRLKFSMDAALGKYCIEKGSIALNGISLTLNAVKPAPDNQTIIEITIIPHTWEHTNLHALVRGHEVNVEVDVIAKYVESLCLPYLKH